MLSHFQESFGDVLGFTTAIVFMSCCFVILIKLVLTKDFATFRFSKDRVANKHFNRDQILEDILKNFENAKASAKDFADKKLEDWVQSLQPNIEEFLEGHFDYFYQKTIGVVSIISKDRLQKEVAHKIEVSILSPTQMGRKVENILTQTVDVYAVTDVKFQLGLADLLIDRERANGQIYSIH